ncbi:DUF481 domain-containing protein [Sneathiella marina]|uniref:DUF481 domain-containing protein n=1 Tax=Sneathiella marina TaxID=2950108 RepID=A0ABY4W3A0_9PROT|nr:DUF481 domain-containing protein [Sneathiella marina]USG60593.1 DUF481 domain-containing protein [Sneathiella marina]
MNNTGTGGWFGISQVAARTVILGAALLAVSAAAQADEVFLKNGDRLTGTVVSKAEDKLVFETKYAGKVEINWADISRLTTDQAVRIQLDDDKMLEGPLTAPADNKLEVVDTAAGAKEVDLSQVAAINPPDLSGLRYSGFFNIGLKKEEGNTDAETYHIDGEGTFRWPDDRVIVALNADYENTDGVNTKQTFNLFNTYDYFIDEQWFWNNGLSFEHDKYADLRLRTTATTGLGYQIYDTNRTSLSVQAGPGYVVEDFYAGSNSDYAAAIWALRFRHVLLEDWKLEAFHNHRLTQGLENMDDYVFLSQTGVRVPIFDNFQTTLQVNFDRDNAPGAGAKKNDTTYLLTVGYAW